MRKSNFQFFVEKVFGTVFSLIKILLLSRINLRYRIESLNSDCVILGNGPSLENSIISNLDFTLNKDLICVNHFAETNLYSTLRPEIYILAAPEMWLDDVEEFYYNKGEKLFSAISNNTKWSLNLFIPVGASKFDRWQKIIEKNLKIKINFYNQTPIEGFSRFEYFCFSRGLGMPRPHNVLIPSLIIAINIKYKNIFLLGADHSWMKDIWVNDNNEVLLTQKHFYDIKVVTAKSMDSLGRGSRKMHEVLIKFVYAFKGYFKIKDYSENRGVEIFNATPMSLIDAFNRYNL